MPDPGFFRLELRLNRQAADTSGAAAGKTIVPS